MFADNAGCTPFQLGGERGQIRSVRLRAAASLSPSKKLTSPAYQAGKSIEEFAVWPGVIERTNHQPNLVTVDLNAMHLVYSRVEIGAGNEPCDRLPRPQYLELIFQWVVGRVAGRRHELWFVLAAEFILEKLDEL